MRRSAPFRDRLQALKRAHSLAAGWYPYDSLASLDMLDRFPGDAETRLREMSGGDPVLDIGCADGDIAFFLESLGMPVDAVDFAPSNHNHLAGVHALKDLLRSNVAIHAVDLDTRPHLPRSNYGLAIMLGILYHLKNPFLVLETLARHARHVVLSTRIASLSPDRRTNFGAQPVAYLVGDDELNQDRTNFWIFSEAGLQRLMHRAGWDVLDYITTGPASQADPVSEKGDVRAFLVARSRLATPAGALTLGTGWHDPEEGGWRWTARRFSAEVELAAARVDATLRFVFHIPKELLAHRRALTIRGSVAGSPLPPSTFTTSGEHEYAAGIPHAAGRVPLEFELDDAYHPGKGDLRELGVLVDFSGAAPITIA